MSFKSRPGHNLFTLHSEQKLEDNIHSDESSIMEETSGLHLAYGEQQTCREQIQSLLQQIQGYKKSMHQCKLKNKQLKDSLQVSQLQNKKHEQKQRQLIKKLSHEQVLNKQFQYQVKKAQQEVLRVRENARALDARTHLNTNNLKRAQEERVLFVQSFNKVAQAIAKCEKVDEFQSCISKFLDFIKKNIKAYQNAEPNKQFEFDLKFELGQVSILKNKSLEQQTLILKLKQDLETEKAQKKKLAVVFNERIVRLKQQCDELRTRLNNLSQQMNQRENEAVSEINTLKKAITQKNQIISELKFRVDSEKKGKDSICSRKSRARRKSYYISDGQREQGKPLSEIQNQIEDLERQLIQVIQDIKQ